MALATLHYAEELTTAVEAWDARGWPRPRVLLVAGSGLSVDLGARIAGPSPMAELYPFPLQAVSGHPLALELLEPHPGRVVLYCRGRLHAYQGYTPGQVVFGVRLAALLGARLAILSNAAGGLDPDRPPGSLMLIRDHLNLTGRNPLLGAVPEDWGPPFVDLVGAYDGKLRELARRRAAELGIELGEGVYAGLLGPSYETPAEIEMLARIGADLVGMSTVLEVIAARQLGVRCLGLSLVTNLAAGVAAGSLHHQEVLEVGERAAAEVARLLGAILSDPVLDGLL